VTSILNYAPAVEGVSEEFFENTDYLILNEVELEMLSQNDGPIKTVDDAKRANRLLLHRHAVCVGVVATLGEQGVVYTSRKDVHNSIHIPSMPANVVDTAGAGDAFVGSFTNYLNRYGEEQIEKVIRLACNYASLTVQTKGTQSSYPFLDTLDDKFK
jgi:ribokinase